MTRPDEDAALLSCAMAAMRALADGAQDADFDAAVAELTALPAHLPGRGLLAAGLLQSLMGADLTAPDRNRHVGELLAIAQSDPPPLPDWPKLRAEARVLDIIGTGLRSRIPDVEATLAEVDGLAAAAGDDPRMGDLLDMARNMLEFERAFEEGDETAIIRLREQAGTLGHSMADDPEIAQMRQLFAEAMGMMDASRRGDLAQAWQAFERLQASAGALPPDHLVHEVMADAAGQMGLFKNFLVGDGHSPPGDEEINIVEAIAERSGASDRDRMHSHLALGGVALMRGHENDLARIDTGLHHFRQARALATPDDPQLPFALQSLAMGLLHRSEVAGNTEGLDEAERLLEQARDLLGDPRHPQWPLLHEVLSLVRYRLGRGTQWQQSGLEGLFGYAWRALVQSDIAGTKVAIADADRQAIRLARLCLTENNPIDAVKALDAGRGLMLFAATEVRGIAGRLREAGRADLADRWAAAVKDPGAGPGNRVDDLRREALAVLTDRSRSVAGLLDPPDLPEIRAALAMLAADALVYLVPGEPPITGYAVIVPAQGPMSYMALPSLTLDRDVEVERYLTALADRARDLVLEDDDAGRFIGSLEALCDWAWRAAMGPLLQGYLGLEPSPATGRVPRLVLIPVGDLARIPWQAARHRNGTYAVQIAAISQAVSARLLCENAARPPVPPSAVGLIVGDPDTAGRAQPLHAARREAHEIRRAFYRGARYVGRRPDGSVSPSGEGTADQIRQWLANPSPAAGAMLHLACHGSYTAGLDSAKAYLLLADAELTAEEIVAAMVKTGQREVGLVVLAACHTGRSVHGYDEVYSLGTAFLAGGARSVLSTQWSIPDTATSSLMYMFHHYLRDRAMPTWQALREAQLWMLDAGREPPPRMPADLRPQPFEVDPAHVVSWAGFVHWGQ